MVGGDILINIFGNKADMSKNRQVDNEEAEKYAQQVGARHFVGSAKLGRMVDEVFLDLAKRMVDANGSAAAGSPGTGRGSVAGAGGAGATRAPPRRNTLQVVADDGDAGGAGGSKKKKGGCC